MVDSKAAAEAQTENGTPTILERNHGSQVLPLQFVALYCEKGIAIEEEDGLSCEDRAACQEAI